MGQKILIISMMLIVSFTTFAAGSNGGDLKTSSNLSSLTGIEIAGLVALVIFLIIVLSARERRTS